MKRSAIVAFILVLPALILLPSVIFNVTPIQDFLEPLLMTGEQLNIAGHIFVNGGVLVLPFAFVIALTPLFRKNAEEKRSLPLTNIIVALIALALILPVSYELGKDFYNCDVLKIPNCD